MSVPALPAFLAVRRRPTPADHGKAEAAAWTELLRKHPGAPPLLPAQGRVLTEASQAGPEVGLFGTMGVGIGKTLSILLMGMIWQPRRPVLLAPAKMEDTFKVALATWAPHYPIVIPRFITYEHLSNFPNVLLDYGPDCLFADEAHWLRNRASGRTKRVYNYLNHGPPCRFVPVSGTIAGQSVRDYAHLAEWALRGGTFLPTTHTELAQLASVVDLDGRPDSGAERLASVVCDAMEEPTHDVHGKELTLAVRTRRALRRRMAETPGVVVSHGFSHTATVYLEAFRPSTAAEVAPVLREIERDWQITRADGEVEIFEEATAVEAAGRHVSCGFYYVPDWPVDPATGAAVPDKEWKDARSVWHKAVRSVARRGIHGLETEALIRDYVGRWVDNVPTPDDVAAGQPWVAYQAFRDWRRVPENPVPGRIYPVCDRPPPPVRTVWLSYDYVDSVVAFARAAKSIGIFVHSDALFFAFAQRGLPCYGQGDGDVPTGTPIAVMKSRIHAEGKNYQWWSKLLDAEPTPNASEVEQKIGRVHRTGQKADEVFYYTALATNYQIRTYRRLKERARLIEDLDKPMIINHAVDRTGIREDDK